MIRWRQPDWWLGELPPLPGQVRFLFYTGLLVTTFVNQANPLRGIEWYAATDPALFRSYGLLNLLGVPYLPPSVMRLVIGITLVAWVMAALGLFTRAAMVTTAAGILFLQGMFFGSNGLNQNWFLAAYACVALCFSRPGDQWSIDRSLRQWLPSRAAATPPRTGIADTGFARALILVAAVGFYFASGITKLLTSGLRWMDGQTIGYMADARRGRYPLGEFLASAEPLWPLLGVMTMVFEAGAVAAIFSRTARHLWILGLVGLHIGIRFTLGPAYWENIMVLGLLVDWNHLTGYLGRWRSRLAWLVPARSAMPALAPDRARRAVRSGMVCLSLVLVTPFLRTTWWPLTNVYMYSSYYSLRDGVRAGRPLADYSDPGSLQRIATELRTWPTSMDEVEFLAYRVRLRLSREIGEAIHLTEPPGAGTWKQWVLSVVLPDLLADLAEKPPGRIALDPSGPRYPAQRFLEGYTRVLHEKLPREVLAAFDRVEITFLLGDQELVLAAVPLNGHSPEDAELSSRSLPPAVCEEARSFEAAGPVWPQRCGGHV